MTIYAFLTDILVLQHLGGMLWIAITGLSILGLARIALIAYMNISSYIVPPGRYLQDAFPALLGFVGLCSLQGADRIAEFLRSRG